MLLQLGPLASAVAGSIGGTTFQRHTAGTIARSKPLPTLVRTSWSSTRRQFLATLAGRWRGLTDIQRALWLQQANNQPTHNRFGVQIPNRGYWLFCQCNLNAYTFGGSFQTTPSTVPTWPLMGAVTLTADLPSTLSLDIALYHPIPSGFAVAVSMAPPCSPGLYRPSQSFRLLKSWRSGTSFPQSLAIPFLQRFAAVPAAGQQQFFRIHLFADPSGQAAPVYQSSTLWTP